MHPTEVIEFIVVGVVIAVIILISFILKGNRRKFGLVFATVVLLAYSVFFIARPNWIDAQIEKKVEMLEPYLEQQYPNDEWIITTVPHKEDGYKHLNPYYIGVVFEDEPEVTYHYWVEKNNIYQVSFSTKKENLDELKFKDSE
ncbi:hypothetical protein FS935_00375 [Metabacillus litoralis]|uniref:DUF3139 domain-containing protein n=1 Tax=Metabacillus litoralis TaxID=152268 RepID=A0A5C6W4I7_9BACI|nr:DUF3139 domain-containing protein [Metabacillus litoralis]TXC92701.1 hypothetical protein FS935_00375 [Metabacillus litoralis]